MSHAWFGSLCILWHGSINTFRRDPRVTLNASKRILVRRGWCMFLTCGSANLPWAALVVGVALARLLRTGRGARDGKTCVSRTGQGGGMAGLMALRGCARGRMPLRCMCAGQACRPHVRKLATRVHARRTHTCFHVCIEPVQEQSMRTSPSSILCLPSSRARAALASRRASSSAVGGSRAGLSDPSLGQIMARVL